MKVLDYIQQEENEKKKGERIDKEIKKYANNLSKLLYDNSHLSTNVEIKREWETYGGPLLGSGLPATEWIYLVVVSNVEQKILFKTKILKRSFYETKKLKVIHARVVLSRWSERNYELRTQSIEVFDKNFLTVMKKYGKQNYFECIKNLGNRTCPACGRDRPRNRNVFDGDYSKCLYCGDYTFKES